MTVKSDDVLKLSLAAAALAGGLSVAYHYAVYIPAKDSEAQAKQRLDELQQATSLAAQKADVEKRQREKNAAYRICLSNADEGYRSRWNASCKRLATEESAQLQRCFSGGYTEQWCRDQYQVRPEANCSLPSQTANDYDASHERERQQCLDEAKAEVGSFSG